MVCDGMLLVESTPQPVHSAHATGRFRPGAAIQESLDTSISRRWPAAGDRAMESQMSLEAVRQILCIRDGDLPDINFDFGQQPVAGDAYAIIQVRATHLACKSACYWSRSKSKECVISFGENPALAVLAGEADPFHVLFGGLRSASGAPIPDLGVFVLDDDFIALDYRMGPHWDEPAILGLFEIMQDLKALAKCAIISHAGNIFETDEEILLSEFNTWSNALGH